MQTVVARQHIVDGAETVDANTVLVRKDNRPFCSGILISPHVVLTAAHCETPFAADTADELDVLRYQGGLVYVGSAVASRAHPDWLREGDAQNDLGLLAFESASPTWASVPHRPFDELPPYGVALGYGVTAGRDSARRTACATRAAFPISTACAAWASALSRRAVDATPATRPLWCRVDGSGSRWRSSLRAVGGAEVL